MVAPFDGGWRYEDQILENGLYAPGSNRNLQAAGQSGRLDFFANIDELSAVCQGSSLPAWTK